jgi:hypothetical protein
MKAYIEKPVSWLYSKSDGQRHKLMYKNLIRAIDELGIDYTEQNTYRHFDFQERTQKPDGFCLSYHSVGNTPYVWRIKETSIPFFYSVDRFGYSGWSELSTNSKKHEGLIQSIDIQTAKDFCEAITTWLTSENLSKYSQSLNEFSFTDAYILYPMQVLSDKVSIHHNHHPLKILLWAAKAAKKKKQYLIVKRHPFCKNPIVGLFLFWFSISNKYFISSKASITKLLSNCKSVIVGNSGTGLEALIYGKSVHSFSSSEYRSATSFINSPNDILSIFEIEDNNPKSLELGYKFSYYYLTNQCFDCRDTASIKRKLEEIISITKSREWQKK